MRKQIAILLILIYAFGATDVHQLFKLPLLVVHYEKHHRDNPSITIGQFLKIHYLDPQPFDKDYQEDMKLPFKASRDYCAAAMTVMPPVPVSVCLVGSPKVEVVYVAYEEHIPSEAAGRSVFQPPRLI